MIRIRGGEREERRSKLQGEKENTMKRLRREKDEISWARGGDE